MRSARPTFHAASFLSVCAMLLVLNSRGMAEWPQFRGVHGDGIVDVNNAPLRWSVSENIAWRTDVPGEGWSSPVLVGDKIWMTTAEVESKSSVVLKAVEVDLATGKLGRIVDLFRISDPVSLHKNNSHASPSPVTDGARLYCHFGTYGTCCLDTVTGKVLWRNQEHQLDHDTGPSSSPVLVEDYLILPCDGVDVQYVAGLNKDTGKTVWRTDRPEHRDRKKSHATPLTIQVEGQPQVIIPGAQWLCAYDPTSGKEIWRFDFGDGYSVVPRPVYGYGVVYLCTGFSPTDLVAVRVQGQGDVTATNEVWRMSRRVPTISSPILVDDRLYMVSDQGVVSCVDTKTGDSVWVDRLGGNYSASPTLAGGRIYFCNEQGRTTVIEPGDKYKVLAENDLNERVKATPVFIDGAILMRSDQAIYRIGT